MRTTDLCGPRLGLTDDNYDLLLDTVGQVVHAAWNVNFNLPLVEFQPFLRCTRNLAEFCLTAKNKVRLNFLGSYASTFNYPDDYVPESALDTKLSYSLAQGYAISKLLAEHSLLRIREAHPQGFDLSIIRIGQICGDTKTGSWSPHEMMPMLIASLPALKALPICFPPVSWIPADICAGALFDIISADMSAEPQFLHVANPHLVSWLQIGAQIGEISQIGEPLFLSLGEYIQLLKDQPSPVPVSRLLPYFTQALESDTMPERYASLRVVHTMRLSESLQMCPSIGPELLKLMVQGILRVKASASSHTVANSPIFLFGPWSPSSRDVAISPGVIEQRVMGVAKRIQSKLGVTVLSPGSSLEQQLKTLIAQLSHVDSLLKRNITPCAVLGYCFGEYCAAITAGILSEENVIDVLIRRATVTAEVKGAMLNVFGEVAIVRRYLASMQSPPCIGIHAGPKHVILTGGRDDIISARDGLLGRGIKSMMIDTTLPFHSSLMEVPISYFDPPTTYTPRDSDSGICFISGITSEFLPGSKLGWKYWLRHLRDPVDFYGAMRYARHNLPGRTFVDIGPGQTLTKIIDRFQWPDIIVVGPRDVVPANMNPVEKFLSHPTTMAMKPKSRPLISHGAPSGQDFNGIALQLLKDLFGYESLPGLLEHSLHSLGLQSLDFIRFSDCFEAQTGMEPQNQHNTCTLDKLKVAR
ncbi:hypothetical protein EDD85DRAFT_460309 [Armillaria nabsnona]|nr:hypothetical protein EDD85DRAFT_460309 [Armillaria nabsnona]